MTSSSSNFRHRLAENLAAALRAVTETLNSHGVQYALIGGLAVAVRGHVRATMDVDFLTSIPQVKLPPMLDELQQRGFVFDQIEVIRRWSDEGMIKLTSDRGVRVDVLKSAIPLFNRILHRATAERFEDLPIRVADVEGLLILKLVAFRQQDQMDIQALLAAYSGRLDLEWVRQEWSQLEAIDPSRLARFEEMVAEFEA